MKIAVLSDLHFGYAYNSELENDCFENAEEAIEKALSADLILIAGDIFDSRVPKTNVWARAIRLLVKPLLRKNGELKLLSSSKELKEISRRTLHGIPIVTIHGTHERRGKEETNVIEALEHAGILIHLHCDNIVFEKDGKKVAIFGMSGVPERYAKDVLDKWNPQPLEECFNILMMHQSINPYVYSPLEPPTISLSNLPKGFNLIIDGHIHGHSREKINGTNLILPGSTVITQMEKNEAETKKGFYFVEVGEELKIEFVPLQKARQFFYEEMRIDDSRLMKDQLELKIKDVLSRTAESDKKPLVKIKVIGKEEDVSEQEFRELEKKYSEIAIVNFVKSLESSEVEEKIEFLRNLRDQKLSIEEIGLQLLKKNLNALDFAPIFDHEQTFRLLSEGEVEKTFNILTGQQILLTDVLDKR